MKNHDALKGEKIYTYVHSFGSKKGFICSNAVAYSHSCLLFSVFNIYHISLVLQPQYIPTLLE